MSSQHVQSTLLAAGGFLPQHVLTNDDLSKTLETSHEWIVERTGICQRHLVQEGQSTSDLAYKAAQRALQKADLSPEHIDLILVATSTPDHAFPPCAQRVQHLLGASHAIAFDINVACSGFLFALTVADAYLKQGRFRYALVIGAETLSRLVDWQDRSTAILFGDGAGAVLLKAENSVQGAQERGLLNSRLRTGGGHYDLLYADAKGIYMNGREVFRHAVQELEAISKEVLEEGGYKQEDVDWLIPHQANKRIIDAVTQRMGVSSDKVLYAGNLHANTSAASIPLVLWKAMEEGKIKPGHLLLFQAFGAGFSSGAVLARF